MTGGIEEGWGGVDIGDGGSDGFSPVKDDIGDGGGGCIGDGGTEI